MIIITCEYTLKSKQEYYLQIVPAERNKEYCEALYMCCCNVKNKNPHGRNRIRIKNVT